MTGDRQSDRAQMPVADALQVLIDKRAANQVVVTHQGSARLWPSMERHDLDFHYNPSTMGGAIPFGLGLALANVQREVIVVTGDGSLLMSLGSLVSVVDSGAENLSIIVLDNRLYEVTGGQWRPGASAPLDFAAMARAAGFPSVATFDCARIWQQQAGAFLASSGPRLAWLLVAAANPHHLAAPAIPLQQQIQRLGRVES